MQQGAVGTQTQQAVILTVNGLPVKTMQDLQSCLDPLVSGAKVTIAYKSKGKDMVIEGSVK